MVSVRVTAVCLWVLLIAGSADADLYFNSSEPGCNGSDPNVLLCDDFEDGIWYRTNCDTSGGVNNPDNDGWCGTIFKPINPPDTILCGGAGAVGTNCAANLGPHTGAQEEINAADHSFSALQEVAEVYIRFYYKAASGYEWGAEKLVPINRCCAGGGGIKWGDLHWNCGAGGRTTTPSIQFQATAPQNECLDQNQGNNIQIVSGRWYFMEMHLILSTNSSTPNGTFQLWINDCGANGLGCTGTPTLRTSRTNITYSRLAPSEQIGSIWMEGWANPGSLGTAYFDQLKVSKVGPIGFMSGGSATPPSSPINLIVN